MSDQPTLPDLEPEAEAPAPIHARPYQTEAKRAIYASLREHRSTLLVLPTGTGKTVVFATVVRDGVAQKRRVLILAHRAELIEQGAAKIAAVAGCEVGIEMAAQRDGSRGTASVLMASVQSITRRLDHFEPDAFDLIIVDECFPAGTLVDGTRIEDLVVGDQVTCYDHDGRRRVVRPVLRTFKSKPSRMVAVVLRASGARRMDVACTPGHPFHVHDRGYVPAYMLKRGDYITAPWMVERVVPIQPTSDGTFGGACPDGYVYNIEVADHHNYFANNVLVHNCHHAIAKTYRAILDYFASAKVLGVTATPNRGDKVKLREVFEDVAFDLPILDAIEGGWLVPIQQRIIETTIDFSALRKSKGDFSKKDLEEVMTSIEALHEIAEPTVEAVGERQAIVFCVTVLHAHLLAEAIREQITAHGQTPRVEVVTGNTPDDERRDIFAGFRAGVVQYLVNVEVATEGTDLPTASVIVMARPTLSEALYKQMLGRGTRPLPGVVDAIDAAGMVERIEAGEFDLELQAVAEVIARESKALERGDDAAARRLSIRLSGKPHMLVLDFAGNSGKHSLISGLDALDGKDLDEQLAKEVRKILDAGEADLIEAIRLARARRAEKTRGLRARHGDPFALFGLPEPEPDRWGRAATDAQLAALRRAGMPTSTLDLRQASSAISAIVERSRAGLATYKQCRALARFGAPLDVVESVTLLRATELMSFLEASKWRPETPHWWAVAPGMARGVAGSTTA